MIGIIASMDEELSFVIDNMEEKKEERKGKFNFIIGKIGKNKIVAVRCFTGKVYMAMTAQSMIENYDVDLIINIGVAGGLVGKIGDVAIATDTMQTDMNATPLGYALCEIPDISKTYFKASENVLRIINKIKKFPFDVITGRILTADKFVNSLEDSIFLRKEYNGVLTDMESASLGEVCYVNDIDFSIIRAISDKADDTSDKDFKENLRTACDNCGKVTIEVLKML